MNAAKVSERFHKRRVLWMPRLDGREPRAEIAVDTRGQQSRKIRHRPTRLPPRVD